VLLTPVGLAIARQTGIAPMPFALTTLWIANTGSLLLPVSNLTNLLAVHRFEDLGAGHGDYVRTAALPALTAIVATLVLIALLQRRSLRGTYAVDPPADPHGRPAAPRRRVGSGRQPRQQPSGLPARRAVRRR
jgi:arsenical pump membrane protein